jgi:hypothetical protein
LLLFSSAKKTKNADFLPFFLQQKKGSKKCRRYRKKAKNQCLFLKTGNSLRSNSPVFLTKKPLIFLTLFSLGGKNSFGKHLLKTSIVV